MTGLVVHQCPKCVLRFSYRTEMEYHLREDHPQRAPAEQAPAVTDGETAVRVALPKGSPVTAPLARQRGTGWSRARTAALMLSVAGALIVVYAAVFVSLSTAVIVAALLLALSLVYVRSARGRARLRRR